MSESKLQWTGDNFDEVKVFCGDSAKISDFDEGLLVHNYPRWLRVYHGDFIVATDQGFVIERPLAMA